MFNLGLLITEVYSSPWNPVLFLSFQLNIMVLIRRWKFSLSPEPVPSTDGDCELQLKALKKTSIVVHLQKMPHNYISPKQKPSELNFSQQRSYQPVVTRGNSPV